MAIFVAQLEGPVGDGVACVCTHACVYTCVRARACADKDIGDRW